MYGQPENPPERQSYGGFRPATTGPNGGASRLTLCSGEDQLLTVLATPHHGIATTITYRVATYAANGPCRPQPLPPQYGRPPFPLLYDPPAAAGPRVFGTCDQSMPMTSGTGTAFGASMSADAILDHYARQLADSGWTAEGRGGSIVGRTWTRSDSTGAPVRLSLTVTTPSRDSTCHEVSMQVRTRRKP